MPLVSSKFFLKIPILTLFSWFVWFKLIIFFLYLWLTVCWAVSFTWNINSLVLFNICFKPCVAKLCTPTKSLFRKSWFFGLCPIKNWKYFCQVHKSKFLWGFLSRLATARSYSWSMLRCHPSVHTSGCSWYDPHPHNPSIFKSLQDLSAIFDKQTRPILLAHSWDFSPKGYSSVGQSGYQRLEMAHSWAFCPIAQRVHKIFPPYLAHTNWDSWAALSRDFWGEKYN